LCSGGVDYSFSSYVRVGSVKPAQHLGLFIIKLCGGGVKAAEPYVQSPPHVDYSPAIYQGENETDITLSL
jgi:hypothetical protein